MSVIWNAKEIEQATAGKANADFAATGIEIDSRKVKKGDIFVALKGINADGHNFIEEAIQNGAVAVIVNKSHTGLDAKLPLVTVADTYQAVLDMAKFNRARTKAVYVAVTGSVGKTSTKEMMRTMLSTFGSTHASEGNFNNNLGLPLSLARMHSDSKYAVFELGMNHKGELRELSKMLQPNIAVITNVEPVHLEFFNSVGEIALAKAEILENMQEDGVAILNIDNQYYNVLEAQAKKNNIKRIISFGMSKFAKARLNFYDFEFGISAIEATIGEQKVKYNLGLAGKHQAVNSLAVLACAMALRLDMQKAAASLASFSAVKGRGQLFQLTVNGKKFTMIDDSYNASPASIAAALSVLGHRQNKGRKIAILADMLELGENSANLHKGLLHDIVTNNIDGVITVGAYMKELYDILPTARKMNHYKNVETLIPEFLNQVKEGDLVLVKGSLGTAVHKLVNEYVKYAI